MEQRDIYWIWISRICGPDSDIPFRLLSVFRSGTAIYNASADDYRACPFLNESRREALCCKDLTDAYRISEICARQNIGMVSLESPLYPERLRSLQHPPALLYYRGSFPDFDNYLTIGVVGTRKMTPSGQSHTYRLSYELSRAGAAIVSGMALGVDGAAGKAALDAGGVSAAVLGTAIDVCYPSAHRELYNRLILSGCLISEYAPGTGTNRRSFPQRNRIISGLSQAVLITEADERSGAMITARDALTQGRDIFAVPGDPSVPGSAGPNALIKNGAFPVTASGDILNRYSALYDGLFPERAASAAREASYDIGHVYAQDEIREHIERTSGAENRQQPTDAAPKRAETELPASRPAVRRAPKQLPVREEPLDDALGFLNAENCRPSSAASCQPESAQICTPVCTGINGGTAPSEKPPKTAKLPDAESPSEKPSAPDTEQKPQPSRRASDLPESQLTDIQRKVLEMVKKRWSFDRMCREGYSESTLFSTLTVLELGKYINSLPGGIYEYIE